MATCPYCDEPTASENRKGEGDWEWENGTTMVCRATGRWRCWSQTCKGKFFNYSVEDLRQLNGLFGEEADWFRHRYPREYRSLVAKWESQHR